MFVLDGQFLKCGNDKCHRILKRLPPIYFKVGIAYYGCENCDIVYKAWVENSDIVKFEKDSRSFEKYMQEVKEKGDMFNHI